MCSKPLRFLAGPEAMARIRRDGLHEDLFDVVAGASGGAKWLALTRLDQALFGRWFRQRARPLHMVGSSIGTWRFACLAQPDPVAAARRFEAAYLDYAVDAKVTSAELTDHCRHFLREIFGTDGIAHVLSHPFMRQSILTVRARGPMGPTAGKVRLGLGLSVAGLANLASRRSLPLFFERTVLHDRRDPPPFDLHAEFPTQAVPLTQGNLVPALLASSAVPFVFDGVVDPEGARPGLYLDGGIMDYHLDMGFTPPGLILYPHFSHRVIPGWFDKKLPWRRARESSLSRMLVLCPSVEFARNLPFGKIPDRGDFKRMDTATRQKYWRTAVAETDRLADCWLDALEKDRVPDLMEPLFP
ncbi:patatin-like phospholipase family protein [Niveispirillum sp.]|uniref:patatin-like phospholipase family protein n=1 Tax=Niveispirillum sp. TaxID=1917217 RepID=UPI001B3CD2EA|nr:patatin-like phospholipase family protein [Niveispirillum sp.]MBP7339986.1 patatin-like phospholipase family protein [Niveispirillum sp.]